MKPLTKKDPGYADRNKGPSAKSGDSRAECERAGAGKSSEVDTEIDEANALRIKVVFLCDARVVVFLCACLLESNHPCARPALTRCLVNVVVRAQLGLKPLQGVDDWKNKR